MHVFDSFAGLPETASSYYKVGDFTASFDEVEGNVRIFGSPEAVVYHRGYFNDSIRTIGPLDLACMWMDVDLEASAVDVMKIADRLHRNGAVFSHECAAANFVDGTIIAHHGVDNVIPPIVDRFDEMRLPLTGRFMCGHTGAFWHRETGYPVLSNSVLHKLIRSL